MTSVCVCVCVLDFLQVTVGKVYNERAISKAVQNIKSLDLFSSIDVIRKQDEKNGSVSAEFVLQEHPPKWSELNTEWNIVRDRRLTLVTFLLQNWSNELVIVCEFLSCKQLLIPVIFLVVDATQGSLKPSATISFGHRNIKGLKRSFEGAITLSNLFDAEVTL